MSVCRGREHTKHGSQRPLSTKMDFLGLQQSITMRFTQSIQRLLAHGSHFRLFLKHGNHAGSLLKVWKVFSARAHTNGSMCRCICSRVSSSERLSVTLCFDLMSGQTGLFKSSEDSMIDAAQPLYLMNGYTMLAIRGQRLGSTAWKRIIKCVEFLHCSRLTLPSCCEGLFPY